MILKSSIKLPGQGNLKPSYLVIHETANPGVTAKNHLDYWQSGRSGGIYTHAITDWTGNTVEKVCNFDKLCWHVGGGNSKAIGIELCHATNKKDFETVWKNGTEFAAYICKLYGWPSARVISHKTAGEMWGGTDHTDPIEYFAKYDKTFTDFRNDVESLLKGEDMKPIDIWSYKNKRINGEDDAYSLLTQTLKIVKELQKKIERMEKK